MQRIQETVGDKQSVVILMHDASDKILTYECLPEMIQYFKDNGYEFKTMYDVIGRGWILFEMWYEFQCRRKIDD